MIDGLTLPETEKGKHPAADEIAALWRATELRLKRAVTARKTSWEAQYLRPARV